MQHHRGRCASRAASAGGSQSLRRSSLTAPRCAFSASAARYPACCRHFAQRSPQGHDLMVRTHAHPCAILRRPYTAILCGVVELWGRWQWRQPDFTRRAEQEGNSVQPTCAWRASFFATIAPWPTRFRREPSRSSERFELCASGERHCPQRGRTPCLSSRERSLRNSWLSLRNTLAGNITPT